MKTNNRAQRTMLATLMLATSLLISQVNSSGIFELNLSSLIDQYGHDLRQECCAWQNASNLITTTTNQHPQVSKFNQQQQQQQSCDPTKCQLIVRICVKNYQTQIDPSQCTFGELSAQVMRPNEQSYNSISSNSLNNQNSYSPQQQRLLQQQQLNLINKRLSALNANNQQPMNIHHQRMLLQQLQQSSYGSQVMTHEQHSRLHHHNHQLHPRALRQVVFDQPISFPFNFTWPVSTEHAPR